MPRRTAFHSSAHSLSRVREAVAAHSHARAIGFPLNFTLDIHWEWTRFAKEDRQAAVALLLESLRHWLIYHDTGFYSIAVREYPPDSDFGEHLHLLLHVPPELGQLFLAHVRKFLRGKMRLPKTALAKDTPYNDGKLAYILKGCTKPARKMLAAIFNTDYEREKFLTGTKDSTRQGEIYGKRLLVSQSLGPKARRGEKRAINDKAKPSPSTARSTRKQSRS